MFNPHFLLCSLWNMMFAAELFWVVDHHLPLLLPRRFGRHPQGFQTQTQGPGPAQVWGGLVNSFCYATEFSTFAVLYREPPGPNLLVRRASPKFLKQQSSTIKMLTILIYSYHVFIHYYPLLSTIHTDYSDPLLSTSIQAIYLLDRSGYHCYWTSKPFSF